MKIKELDAEQLEKLAFNLRCCSLLKRNANAPGTTEKHRREQEKLYKSFIRHTVETLVEED